MAWHGMAGLKRGYDSIGAGEAGGEGYEGKGRGFGCYVYCALSVLIVCCRAGQGGWEGSRGGVGKELVGRGREGKGEWVGVRRTLCLIFFHLTVNAFEDFIRQKEYNIKLVGGW